MDNNFDENMTAGQENDDSATASEVPADAERQRDLRDLQDTVTASPLSDASTENNGSIADTEQNIQPSRSAHVAPESASAFQNKQNIQNVQTPSSVPNVHAAPGQQSGQQSGQQFGLQSDQQQFPQYGQYGQYGQFGQNQPYQSYQSAQPNLGNAQQYVPLQEMPQDMQSIQGMVNNGFPPPVPPPQQPTQKKKRFSGGCLWSLISAIVVMFAAVVILAVKIAAGASDKAPENDDGGKFDNFDVTQKAEHIVVDIPVTDKPKLDDELYADRESGLLTSVGVAKVILPSQVQIKVFDEIPYMPVSSGSGIILTEDGYILTNAHVVDGAKRLSVGFYGDGESEAVIVGIDKKSDLAVVKVNKKGLSPAQIGTSSTLEIGEEVALAGAGGGFENTVTYGHVTGLGREIDTDYISSSTITCIQSDAALNPGNSGGALVNMYGQVVGVAVALMNHETYENIGFCIAIDDAVPIAEDLIAQGYVSSRTRVGITYLSIGDAAANGYGIPAGLCVMDVDPRSGAVFAGLKPYDVITHIDGQRVLGAAEISEVLADKVPGDMITISVFRKEITGETNIFDAELELTADTSSVSGYNVTDENEDFFSRDIIK